MSYRNDRREQRITSVLGAVFLVPIVFFYVLAHMAWRSQELRLVTQSMAEMIEIGWPAEQLFEGGWITLSCFRRSLNSNSTPRFFRSSSSHA